VTAFQFYQVVVPVGLAALTAILTFFLRNELVDGTERPMGNRIAVAAAGSAIVLVLALFAAFLPTWFAVYFITWWTTLFAVLPFGVRSQHEDGVVVAGSEPGAPVVHDMRRKMLITTAVSLPVFAGILLALRFLPIL